ncbi:hypothetical protein [Treponema socranskii]|uniref:hypothetical protein n=1 Tax=Treponema socranskii TaxID=53419 RepID=UPI003D8C3D9A
MKYLKIQENKVVFTINNIDWLPIDQITKDHLLNLLDFAINNDFEMDTFDASKIANQAHQIIYKNIYEKFVELTRNKTRFSDESEALYKEAIEKYKSTIT